ncbi:MAG TPA: acetoacetate decarboxylase family protein [Sphingomicrobium sp.]|nr:acetoacetate decarboxylase family protein [Sphingomicrobium sp.]
MPHDFDVARLYKRLPYGTTVPSQCPKLPQISFDCRIEKGWLERNLENTPFSFVEDRVMISAADFGNNNVVPFRDVMVMAPVEYKGERGGHPIVEFEDLNRTVLGGREKWGYPKLYADITFDQASDHAIAVKVMMGSKTIMEMNWTPDEGAPAAAKDDQALTLWPHFLLRTLPDASREGMGFAEILRRDTSDDLEMLDQHSGRGKLVFGGWPEHEIDYCGLADLKIKEIISAQLTIADWYSTEENGWAQSVERLI